MEEQKQLAVVEQLPIITERLEEVSKAIKEKTDRAMSLVATEDNLKDIKKVRAELNKEFKDYETLRKTIKNKIMEKYTDFENRYNTLIGNAFKNAEDCLRGKINEGEYKIISQKEKELRIYFDEYLTSINLNDMVKFEQLNIKVGLSTSDKKLREEVKSKLDNIAEEIKLIKLEEHSEDIMLEYLKDYNYARAKSMVLLRIREKEILEEKMKQKEQADQQDKIIEKKVDDEIVIPVETVEKPVENLTTRFQVTGTKEQLVALKQYMIQNNLKFESI